MLDETSTRTRDWDYRCFGFWRGISPAPLAICCNEAIATLDALLPNVEYHSSLGFLRVNMPVGETHRDRYLALWP